MSATLEVDLDSPVPPFEQVRSQLEAMILNGTLADGARLPTVRALAGDLGLAVGTVARAYRELEGAGLIRTARRGGSVITTPAACDASDGLPPEVSAAVGHLVEVARVHGVTAETLLSELHIRLDP
ncbi:MULTISPECIES: GntR family transcriptional regulator [Arthrobacter]|uniref:GntR family transcriptional regulator n=2 Tax=Arthrobacter TaxID=1663 RepID=A0ABU9KMM8_9MICC|nr:GntR family transcriptional regulator [Arthrobacter sp. YJM1]MDP5227921.1 GntR family transcriptional regulator [Arthrobacter sp. YJM1]